MPEAHTNSEVLSFILSEEEKEQTDNVVPQTEDHEVNSINNGVSSQQDNNIEIVPVRGGLPVNNDSDERYESAGSDDHYHYTAHDRPQDTSAAVPLPSSSRVFSPDGTEFITPANSPPTVPEPVFSRDELNRISRDTAIATHAAAPIPHKKTSHDTLDFSFLRTNKNTRQQLPSDATSIKFYKPNYAKATEEDELRKIQALEDEIMSGKSLDSENEVEESGDSLEYKRMYGFPQSEVLFPTDDVMLRPPSVPSVEYHEDAATPVPVPAGSRRRETGGSNRPSSQGSNRPDDVPQLVSWIFIIESLGNLINATQVLYYLDNYGAELVPPRSMVLKQDILFPVSWIPTQAAVG